MNSATHPDNDKPENVQAADAAPENLEAEPNIQTLNDNKTAGTEDPGQDAATGPKAYVDPTIAAEARIAQLESQVAAIQDKYFRALAENDNLRKRTEREKSDIAKYAVTKFAADMLSIADNLRRAIDAASVSAPPEEEAGPLKALLEGVALTDQELQKSLDKNGIRQIAANGEIFDPHKHQAVMEQDNPSVPTGTILQVFQDGYQIEDRVLRPAMVVVAKGGAKPADAPSTAAAGETETPANDPDTAAPRAESTQDTSGGPSSSA